MSVSGLLLCNLSPKPHFAGRNSLKIGVGQLSPSGSVCGAKLNCGLRLRSVKPMASVFGVSWKRTCAGQSPKQHSLENFKPDNA